MRFEGELGKLTQSCICELIIICVCLSDQITIAKNFGKKAVASCLANVDGNDSRSPIGMPQKMMAIFYPKDRKPSFRRGP